MKHFGMILLLILPLTQAISQAPGNVSTNLRLWLKANDLPLGTVTTWTDASGSGNSPTQVTAGNRPTNIANQLNYNPAVSFDSTDYLRLNFPSLGTLGHTSKEFFCVSQNGNGNILFISEFLSGGAVGDRNVGYIERSSGAQIGIQASKALTPLLRAEARNGSKITNIKNESQTTLNGSHYQVSLNGGSPFVNINDIVSNGSTTTNVGQNRMYVGNKLSVTTILNSYHEGLMSEVIFYSSSMSSTNRRKVVSYLGIKYGQTLGHNYFASDGTTTYFSASYGNDIIGIGRDDDQDLEQKQSHTEDDSTRIYLSALTSTNSANSGSFSSDISYVVMGHNDDLLCATNASNTETPAGLSCPLYSRLAREWKITKRNFGQTFNVDYKLNSCAAIASVNPADLRLLVDNDGDFSNGGTNCFFNGDGSGIVISYSSATITVTGISNTHIPDNSTRFVTIGSVNSGTPLPIDLLTFEATPVNNRYVELEWQTAAEINNDYFTIERSRNGTKWENIKTVNGAGNSSALLSYSSIDSNPYFGTSYYRLKQTDFEGKSEYSPTKSINIKNVGDFQVNIYPNPTKNHITIEGVQDEIEKIKVYNILGQDISTLVKVIENNKTNVIVDLSNLSKGVYIVKTKTTVHDIYKQ